ncbi:hypothetical protein B0A55_11064 [Friedmanniomyces simplex]|uniref:GED domain-containing protein n=1 Tax=Friedmanniomyces simplex TaxID=329884 RepID=A0A4U0XBL2_9PEZI|nr:hypothetical protein B0A55_11064 [Friedmanniomyces simplex]
MLDPSTGALGLVYDFSAHGNAIQGITTLGYDVYVLDVETCNLTALTCSLESTTTWLLNLHDAHNPNGGSATVRQLAPLPRQHFGRHLVGVDFYWRTVTGLHRPKHGTNGNEPHWGTLNVIPIDPETGNKTGAATVIATGFKAADDLEIDEDVGEAYLVVCGDQSTGKSSVLEGITGIPFPREEGVCTKFATEVILEHAEGVKAISATIIPHPSRHDTLKANLQAYQRTINGFEELPDVIVKAGVLMGIRGYGDNHEGPSFAEDVLRIKVTGPCGLHLSIVDLPGLISNASEEQTEDDVETVHRMVDSYVEKPRTIILAVVQAGNDIANQSIIRKSKLFDKAGQRTVGIITKPDLINAGAEGRIAALAKNQDTTKLQLGFFLLKNPTPKEREATITPKQRSANELRYFQSPPWKEQKLDTTRVGIDKLQTSLQALLDRHIEKELPKVREEIKSTIRTSEQEMFSLPPERPTISHLRMFLSDLAMQYHSLATAALNGDYHTSHTPFFTANGTIVGSTRLRALIHKLNTEFSDYMREKGEKLKLGHSRVADPPIRSPESIFSLKKKKKAPKAKHAGWDGSGTSVKRLRSFRVYPADVGQDDVVDTFATLSDTNQRLVTEIEMKAWVRKLYLMTRGRELPGNYNHVLLTELFHQQSVLWQRIATEHVEHVHETIGTFVNKAIAHLRVEEQVFAGIKEGIDCALQEGRTRAEEELMRLCADEQQQPIAYNHYYTDNVQKSRLDSTQKTIERAMEKVNVDPDDLEGTAVGNMSAETLVAAIRQNIVVNMDEQAYNVCKQVIERHLLRNLPDIFSPKIVAMYTDEELERIAMESPGVVEKRKQLREQLANLAAGLEDLRK